MTTKNQSIHYTGVRGVAKNIRGSFDARIMHDHKQIHLGTFDTVEQASETYQKAAEYLKKNRTSQDGRKTNGRKPQRKNALENLMRKYPNQLTLETITNTIKEEEEKEKEKEKTNEENTEKNQITIKISIYLNEKEILTKIL